MNRPIVIWTMEYVVAVWIITPIVNTTVHMRMEFRRPTLSVVSDCKRAARVINHQTTNDRYPRGRFLHKRPAQGN